MSNSGVMLDTNMVSHLMREPRGAIRTRMEQYASAAVSIISLAELRFGIEKRRSERLALALDGLLQYLPVLPLTVPVDRCYAAIRTELERRGRAIGPNDLFIAAHALVLDLTLVTANVREFSRVPGLRVENWLD